MAFRPALTNGDVGAMAYFAQIPDPIRSQFPVHYIKMQLFKNLLYQVPFIRLVHNLNGRILVLGMDEHHQNGVIVDELGFVSQLRKAGFKAFGYEPKHVIEPHYVRGEWSRWPFLYGSFSMVVGLDMLLRIDEYSWLPRPQRLVILSMLVNEMAHRLATGGFFIVGNGCNEEMEALLKHVGFFKLPFMVDSIHIWQKQEEPKRWKSPRLRGMAVAA